ncbi:MAG: potassium channel protein [Bacteroidales bacterium]|nr:potassium channel protein [Bacteroidales bacterium]MCF8389249.1 potassium channel protein [Bacteroidales bacterium]
MKQVNKNIRTAYISISLLLIIIAIGVTGFIVMGYTFTEAFFMTIITIATVGFKEVHQLDPSGMWFTSMLIIFSFGIFAYAATTFGRYLIDGVFTNYYRDNKLKRKIDKLKDHVVICGYGRNGKQVAIELLEHNVPIIVLEKDPVSIAALQESGLLFIEGDATMEDVLTAANLKDAKALITTLPVNADNLFVVLSAREINQKMTIISRASMDHSDTKLKRAGADNVIMPDKIGGQRMAKLVAQPDIVEFLEYIMIQSKENVVLEEINCKKLANCFDGKSIRELDVRNISGANIIGLKRGDNSFVINPPPELILSSDDQIFALGTKSQMKNLVQIISSI